MKYVTVSGKTNRLARKTGNYFFYCFFTFYFEQRCCRPNSKPIRHFLSISIFVLTIIDYLANQFFSQIRSHILSLWQIIHTRTNSQPVLLSPLLLSCASMSMLIGSTNYTLQIAYLFLSYKAQTSITYSVFRSKMYISSAS